LRPWVPPKIWAAGGGYETCLFPQNLRLPFFRPTKGDDPRHRSGNCEHFKVIVQQADEDPSGPMPQEP